MNLIKRIFALAAVCLVALPLYADNTEENSEAAAKARRPKVGVVLSGGGAKGVAHIGALKMLEEMNIPVDYIVGTSIGSIVGGFYALGYNASELDSLLGHQDWGKLIQDNVHRRDRLYEDKKIADHLLLRIPFMTPDTFDDEAHAIAARQKIPLLNHIPSGFVEGHNLNQLFTAVSVGYQDSVDFNKLPIPFACVAIDLNTKKEVVFHSGNIVEAIRASMAIPGYFSPVIKDGMYLVDGGMANNFPVDVAREMGADIVIGVDLHAYDKAIVKPVENVGDLFGNLLNLMNGRKYNMGRSEADILICPDTGKYGILDFSENVITALVDSGYVAASRNREALEQLAQAQQKAGYDGKRYNGRRKAINISQDSVYVSQISITGVDPKVLNVLLEDSGVQPGTMVSGEEMENAIDNFYSTQAFSKITYAMDGDVDGDQYNLKVNFTPEKLHEFGLSFRFDSEQMAGILVYFALNKHKISGWKATFLGRLSQDPYLSLTGSYAFNNKWQINLGGMINRTEANIYTENTKVFNADVNYVMGEFDLQNKGRNHEFSIGAKAYKLQYGSIMVSKEYTSSLERGYFWKSLSGFAFFGFDNRDKSSFPTRGVTFNIKEEVPFLYRDNTASFKKPYLDSYFDFEAVIPLGKRFALIPQVFSRFIISSDNLSTQMIAVSGGTFGGYEKERNMINHMPFVGLNHTYFSNSCTGIGRLDLRYNIFKNHYVTAMSNVLVTSSELKNLFRSESVVGLALGYSLDTIFGPLGLNFQWSNMNNRFGAYFTFGYSF